MPSSTFSYMSLPASFSGRRCFTSLSFSRLLLIHSLKAACSSLRTMCVAPMCPAITRPSLSCCFVVLKVLAMFSLSRFSQSVDIIVFEIFPDNNSHLATQYRLHDLVSL